MDIHTFVSSVKENRQLAPNVYEIELALHSPAEIRFQAGQFVNIHAQIDGKTLMRPYSIVSSPSEKQVIRLCYKYIAEGPLTNYLVGLKPGDSVTFTGVFGFFTLRRDSNLDLLLLATGVGIAPILSMIETLFEKPTQRKAILYFGVRTISDIFYETKLQKWSDENPQFRYHICLSQDKNPPSPYRGGRITTVMQEGIHDYSGKEAYICGSREMVEEMKGILAKKGMHKELVFTEKFY